MFPELSQLELGGGGHWLVLLATDDSIVANDVGRLLCTIVSIFDDATTFWDVVKAECSVDKVLDV